MYRPNNPLSSYRNPWAAGTIAGIAAYGLGLLATRHILSIGGHLDNPIQIPGLEVTTWDMVIWYYHGAHYVHMSATASSSQGSMPVAQGNNLVQSTADPYLDLLFLVPPVVLIFGGMVVAINMRGTHNATFSMLNGAHVMVGYLAAGLFAAYWSGKTAAGFGLSLRYGASYIETLINLGLAYPIAFGAAGGLLYFAATKL